MPNITTYDPIRAFKFQVSITAGNSGAGDGGNITLGFQKVGGLKTSSDVVEYREGNMPVHKMKLPGLTNYEPITLSRGAGPKGVAATLIDWRYQVAGYQNPSVNHDGVAVSPANGRETSSDFRRLMTIELFDKGISTDGGAPEKAWKVHMAWPSEISISDLNAEASEVLIESIVVQHEGLEFVDIKKPASGQR